MHTITERQKRILGFIVSEYVETANPVGSKALAEKFNQDISSATIRNEMASLERVGLITHPHTSAGRIPTDRGYRLYVDGCLPKQNVDSTYAGLVAHEYRKQVHSVEELIERTSKILSFLTEQAGLVLYPRAEDMILKKIELIPYGDHHLLVVWATTTGMVRNKMLDMKEHIPVSEIIRLNQLLNQELSGKELKEAKSFLIDRLSHVKDSLMASYRVALQIASRAFENQEERRLCVDGSRYVLKQPEFQNNISKARIFFRAVETRDALRQLFDQPFPIHEIRVHIGTENPHQEMWDCAIVTASYSHRNQVLGTLGVLGPKRMPYARVISIVDHVARRLSDVLEDFI